MPNISIGCESDGAPAKLEHFEAQESHLIASIELAFEWQNEAKRIKISLRRSWHDKS